MKLVIPLLFLKPLSFSFYKFPLSQIQYHCPINILSSIITLYNIYFNSPGAVTVLSVGLSAESLHVHVKKVGGRLVGLSRIG